MEFQLKKRGDFWLDLGITHLYYMLQMIENRVDRVVLTRWGDNNELIIDISNYEKFISLLSQEIEVAKEQFMFYKKKDEQKGREVFVRKMAIPLQNAKNDSDGNAVLKEKMFNAEKRNNILQLVFNKEEIAPKSQRQCVICEGSFDYKAASKLKINELKLSVHPLATKNTAISHIRTIREGEIEKETNREYLKNVCPTCYMLGTLQYSHFATIYHTDSSNDQAYLIFPEINELSQAYQMMKTFFSSLDPTDSHNNVKINGKVFSAGLYGTLLAFFEKMNDFYVTEGEEWFSFGTVQKIFPRWLTIKIGTGQLKNPNLFQLPLMSHLNIIFEKQRLPLVSGLLNQLWVKNRDKKDQQEKTDYDATKTFREMWSEGIFQNRYSRLADASKRFYKKGITLTFDARDHLNHLILEWRFKPLGMSEEELEMTKAVGETIASLATANESPRKSLLFRLEKIRTKKDLVNLLSETAKGIYMRKGTLYVRADKVQQLTDFLMTKELTSQQLDDIKNTLTIYGFTGAAYKNKSKDSNKEDVS